MIRKITVILCAMLFVAMAAIPMSCSAKESSIAVGDFWEYSVTSDEFQGGSVTLTYKEEIVSETSKTIGGTSTPVLRSKGTMSGTMSMTIMSASYAGSVSAMSDGYYVKSNFNQVSATMIMDMSLSGGGSTVTMNMGMSVSCNPPLDQYVGNDDLTVGKSMTSTIDITSSGWMNVLGQNTTIPSSTSSLSHVLEVIALNQTITVPAGTFDCAKIKISSGGNEIFWYYSDKVGNYVKTEGSIDGGSMGLTMGSAQLTSYGHGGAALSTYILIIIGVVIIAAILIAVMLMMKKKGPKPSEIVGQPMPPMPQQPQQGMQYPPPPGQNP